MTDTIFYSQLAFVLRQQNYRESSLLLDVLTKEYGRVSLVAKGVRKPKSRLAGLLQPFQLLSLSYFGKHELKTLMTAELASHSVRLQGMALYCGFYANELVCHFLHHNDPHPEVFDCYCHCLMALRQGENIEANLRHFELNLLDAIGYGVELNYDLAHDKPICAEKNYVFNQDNGLTEANGGEFSGAGLLAIQQRQFNCPEILLEAKKLTRVVINSHLQGKPLKSRAVLNSIIKRIYTYA